MRILILGGTRFLGRHVVGEALRRGHAVTTFTRGNLPVIANRDVVPLAGNRDPDIAPGLAALAVGRWDAVVDTSGYVPRIVDASASLLADRVGRYLFVSSVSVYADADRPGVDETGSVATLADPATEDVVPNYGALKAACEAAVRTVYGEGATIVRPGLIVGAGDGSDRFGYWVARFLCPHLLGERAAQAVVPAPLDRPIQLIDARDLAVWILDMLEQDNGGTYNAVCPAGQWTFADLIDALVAEAIEPPQPVGVTDDVLMAHNVTPWLGLPLWLPASEPDAAGFMSIDGAKAQAAGLAARPLHETIRETAEWLVARTNADAWQNVLSAESERKILGAAAQSDEPERGA
jgi:2'-hydroxyisoflavone reductase